MVDNVQCDDLEGRLSYCCDYMLVCVREHLINYSWLASEVLVKWLEGVLEDEMPSPHSS